MRLPIPTGRATTVAKPRRAAAPAPPAGRVVARRGAGRRAGRLGVEVRPRASGRPSARAGARRPRRREAGRGQLGDGGQPAARPVVQELREAGLSAIRISSSYHSTIWQPIICPPPCAHRPAERLVSSACARYCPSRSRASAACSRPTPSAISAGSHVARSCSPSGTSGRPARCARRGAHGAATSAHSRPDTSGSSANGGPSCRALRIGPRPRGSAQPTDSARSKACSRAQTVTQAPAGRAAARRCVAWRG